MKKIIALTSLLLASPLFASVHCLDNSQHLQENFDDKEWHSVACDCPCTTIKGRHCIECGHLQDAHTYIVVIPTKVAQQTKMKLHIPDNPQAVLRKLAFKYLQNKKTK